MNRIRLSELFSSREYKEMELNPKVVDSILKKTIYRKRTSILGRAVLYLTPITAVIMIFVLYQNFFVEIQDVRVSECINSGGGDFIMSESCGENSFPKVEKEKKGILNLFSTDKEINNQKIVDNSIEESDYRYADDSVSEEMNEEESYAPMASMDSMDSVATNLVEGDGGLQTFDEDVWVKSDTVGIHHKDEEIVGTEKIEGNDSSGKSGWGFFAQESNGETGIPGSANATSDNNYIVYYIGGCIGLILILIIYIIRKKKKK